jgi:hypothetical protein
MSNHHGDPVTIVDEVATFLGRLNVYANIVAG